ncbi:hypothetical protein MMC28_001324 [Mycoblastus sanguinarius]|nr:hypothetical protein [Mycoblastus sanguinarius]
MPDQRRLVFEDPVQFKLLKFIIRMISFSGRQLHYQTVSWNRLILLYGLPGTGKTTLCRGLAQKLAIRLGKDFPEFKLVEFDAHSLFSKYFSESGKLVTKLFGMIESMLDEDENCFVCVFIDEVESLASTRQHSSITNEPQDSLRAVNALLIALDRLRYRPNVVVLCTSNLIKAMDPAFLDRVDIKQHIPQPCAKARYEIYRACYLGLAKCGIIAPIRIFARQPEPEVVQLVSVSTSSQPSPDQLFSLSSRRSIIEDRPTFSDSVGNSPDKLGSEEEFHIIDKQYLPPVDLMMLHYFHIEGSLPKRLWEIAEKSVNFSGRILGRLPLMSLAMNTAQDPCSIDDALVALAQAVNNELLVEPKTFTEGSVPWF